MANKIHELLANASMMDKMKFFNQSVYMSVTNRCNAKCRFCIVHQEGVPQKDADYESFLDWVGQIKDIGIRRVNFVGGEPFLLREQLKGYVKKADEAGLYSGIVTNGFWGRDYAKGVERLKELEELNILLISSDKYHLEYIDADTVKKAIEAGLATDKYVVIILTYAHEDEISEVMELYQDYKDQIEVQPLKAMPFGAAANIDLQRSCIFPNFAKIPPFCSVSNIFVDIYGKITLCCENTDSFETFLPTGSLQEESFASIMQRIKDDPSYQFLSKRGPLGVAKAFINSPYAERLKETPFAGHCEFCMELLGKRETREYFVKKITEGA